MTGSPDLWRTGRDLPRRLVVENGRLDGERVQVWRFLFRKDIRLQFRAVVRIAGCTKKYRL